MVWYSSALRAAFAVIRRWKVWAVGFCAGLMNGLIGMGGGTIVVPGLIWARNIPPKAAVITSLCAVFLLSSFSLSMHSYLTELAFKPTDLLLLVTAGVLGAQLGTRLLIVLSNRLLLFAFGGFCLLSAQYLIASALDWVTPLSNMTDAVPLVGLLLVGLLSGLSSGLLGIGGGIVAILGLCLVFNAPISEAVVAALSMNIANAGSGLSVHITRGRCGKSLRRDVLALVPAALLGAAGGSLLSAYLPAAILRAVFGLFVTYVALSMIRRGLRTPATKHPEVASKPAPSPIGFHDEILPPPPQVGPIRGD